LSQASAADEQRFEISSIKAIRPALVATITALRESQYNAVVAEVQKEARSGKIGKQRQSGRRAIEPLLR